MSEIIKPLPLLEKNTQNLTAPWLKDGYSFIRYKHKNPMSALQAILFAVDESDINKLLAEILGLLKKETSYESKDLALKLYQESLYSADFEIKFPKNGNILGGIMVPKNTNRSVAFPIFSKNIRENFPDNAYLFTFTDFVFEYIKSRYEAKMLELDIKNSYQDKDNNEDTISDLEKRSELNNKDLIEVLIVLLKYGYISVVSD